LTNLTNLSIDFGVIHHSNLEELKTLTGLKQVRLDVSSGLADLKAVERLRELTELSLDLGVHNLEETPLGRPQCTES
jgi:hypothetical protein